MAHFNGYQINNGNLTGLTPLQKQAVNCITSIIWKFKMESKPFAVI